MAVINVKLKENSYKIIIGHGNLKDAGKVLRPLKIGEDAAVVTNPLINRLHGRTLAGGLKRHGFSVKFFEVPDGEQSKSASAAVALLKKIAHYDAGKKIFIVAFGCGVIGDLAGFVAAVYKRGVPYVQVPTTLLAQVDSSIGGKVAIDLEVGKNLVGAFHQPRIVYSDVKVLTTLDDRQYRNGFAEVIKYGMIRDKELFEFISRNTKKLLARDLNALTHVVVRCSRIKADVVGADEKETKGIRTILNFGHTAGHAIEAASRFKCFHGEAVALGMAVASEISRQKGMLPLNAQMRLQGLLGAFGLMDKKNVPLKTLSADQIIRLMAHDKKFQGKKNRFVLARRIGQVQVVEGVPEKLIRAALNKWLNR